MENVIVLGAGMVGRAIAADLAGNFNVTSADLSAAALSKLPAEVGKLEADLSDGKRIAEIVADYDLVVGAVPGFMGFNMAKAVIGAGKNLVDISFFDEDPFELDALAKEKGVTAIVDCGVAPGMDNVFLGHHIHRMEVQDFECLVGGLPKERVWPFEYKAPFSPIDVIEEYTRPARIVRNGELVTLPALSEPELLDFREVGTLEAFNSDGLRSLVKLDVPNMCERTLRYPGHIELMRVLRESGFFSKEKMTVNGQEISPLDLTSQLLFKSWKLGEAEEEFTVMRVSVSGKEAGKNKRYVYELLDRRDPKTGVSSMSRTTGYTCTAAVNLLSSGRYTQKGISPPEYLGKGEGNLDFMLAYLQERGVVYTCTVTD